MVVFWKWLKSIDEDTQEEKEIPYLRYYNVFHISQCEGITPKYIAPLPNSTRPLEEADSLIQSYCTREKITLQNEQGNKAYYQPSTDKVVLPMIAQFAETSEYYSVAFHELIHSTGHQSRLNSIQQQAFFGSEAYSKEELVAEIGASALVNHMGIETPQSFDNNTEYIQSWLEVLHNDKRFIVSASSKAEKAVQLILEHRKTSAVEE